MEGAELRVELLLSDGQRRTVRVPVQNDLPSIIDGLGELNRSASRLLSELVEQEKRAGAPGAEEDKDDDDDEEEEESNGIQNSEVQPPTKRSKT